MVNFAPYQNIQRYDQLSLFQVITFKSKTHQVFKDYNQSADPTHLKQWEAVALRIHHSLQAPQTIRNRVLDVISLRFFKRYYLQGFISHHLHISSIVTERKASSYSKPELFLGLLQEAFQKELPALSGKLSNDEIVEIQEYLDEKQNLLDQGLSVALPNWYHATKSEHVFNIMNGANLKQSTQGLQGPGVYFSTEDEHKFYGEYTFALDHRFVKNFSGSYDEGARSTKNLAPCVWLCVQKDIKIQWNSVAHITVDSKQAKQDLSIRMQQDLNDEVLPLASCPILTRAASDALRSLVQKVYMYKIPYGWQHAQGFMFRVRQGNVSYIMHNDILT